MGKLTALEVARITKPGMYSDGDGLYLQVTNAAARSWVYRYSIRGRPRIMGLGSAKHITLGRARQLAVEPRRLRAEGVDPVEFRRAHRLANQVNAAKAVTFKQSAESYIAAHEQAWVPRHRLQWRRSLEADVYPIIGVLPVQAIDTALVLKVLQPIWTTKPETGSRIRQRIESVLDAAKSQELRTGENPARWKGHLSNLLPNPGKLRAVAHMAALPYREMSAFMTDLRTRQGVGARALELTVLCAVRTGEALRARWGEVDFDAAIWVIPAARTKSKKEHRIPLSVPALEILRDLYAQRANDNDLVFPGASGRGLDLSTMLKVLTLMNRRDLTVHGFRSTFRDWAAETTSYPSEVVEMALAHAVGNKVEAAYRRGDLFAKRAQLMGAWGAFCSNTQTPKVVSIGRGLK